MEYLKHASKLKAVREDEAAGLVADSMQVRLALLARFHAGEITLDQVKIELAKIKRAAKKNGQITREKSYTRA